MKYIRDYEGFILESKKTIDKKALVVENSLLSQYSKNFWGLSLGSNVFTTSEKKFIKENLMEYKVDLLKEEWDWLNNVVKSAKNSKVVKFISNKIKSIKKGLSNFAKSISKLAQELVLKIIGWVTNSGLYKKYLSKVDDGLKKEMESKLKETPEESKNEVGNLKNIVKFWTKGEGGDTSVSDVAQKLTQKEPDIQAEVMKNLESAEKVGESSDEVQVSEGNDILWSFYKFEMVTEGSDEGSKRSGLVGWLLDFLEQPNLDPDAKTGKKLMWWGKLFLNTLAAFLNPVMKLIEYGTKTLSNNLLEFKSWVTSAFGGPPSSTGKKVKQSKSGVMFYDFAILGGIVAGIVGLIGDVSAGFEYGHKTIEKMVFHSKHPHGTGSKFLKSFTAGAFGAVKEWIINGLVWMFGKKVKNFKYLMKTIMTAFCVGMIIYHLTHEFQHLKGAH